MTRILDLLSEVLTTIAVLFAVIALASHLGGCTAAQLSAIEDDVARVGTATGHCLWRCGLGCAAQGVGSAIGNPPPPAPIDPEALKAAKLKLCVEEPDHPACRGGE